MLSLIQIIISCSNQGTNPVTFNNPGVDIQNGATLTVPNKMEYNTANIEYSGIPKCLILPSFPDWPTASFVLQHAAIQNDIISLRLSYLGGCEQHEFQLVCTYIQETGVLEIFAQIFHEQNNDPCEQLLTETRDFDLSPIKELYYSVYNGTSDQVIINLIDTRGATETFSLIYKFNDDNLPILPEPPLPPLHNLPINVIGG